MKKPNFTNEELWLINYWMRIPPSRHWADAIGQELMRMLPAIMFVGWGTYHQTIGAVYIGFYILLLYRVYDLIREIKYSSSYGSIIQKYDDATSMEDVQ